MIRFVIFVVLCYILYRIVKSLVLPSSRKHTTFTSGSRGLITDEMVMDPCCKVYIPKQEALTAKIDGQAFYFCSKECKKKYSAEQQN